MKYVQICRYKVKRLTLFDVYIIKEIGIFNRLYTCFNIFHVIRKEGLESLSLGTGLCLRLISFS